MLIEANPQAENGHIDIANEIAEALMKINLSSYEHRVLWCIFRKTYGWKKKMDWMALAQFSEYTRLDRRLVHRALKSLEAKNIIVINRDDGMRPKYGFQKNYRKWKLSSIEMTVINRDDKVSSVEMTEVSSIQIPTKETITKDTIQKKKDIRPGDLSENTILEENTKPKTPPCPHKEIKELYHDVLPELRKVREWTPTRQKILAARWKEKPERQNLGWWKRYFGYVRKCPFLMGKIQNRNGSPPFEADLEWLIRPANFTKIIEGKYEDRRIE